MTSYEISGEYCVFKSGMMQKPDGGMMRILKKHLNIWIVQYFSTLFG